MALRWLRLLPERRYYLAKTKVPHIVNEDMTPKSKQQMKMQLTGQEETASWLTEVVMVLFPILPSDYGPKRAFKLFITNILLDFYSSPWLQFMRDQTVSQIDLGASTPLFRSVQQSTLADGTSVICFDTQYPGGLRWVVDGELKGGFKLPISMLIEIKSFSGKVMIELPKKDDINPKVYYYFNEEPQVEIKVELMFSGRILARLTGIFESLLINQFKSLTLWPNKRLLFDLSAPPSEQDVNITKGGNNISAPTKTHRKNASSVDAKEVADIVVSGSNLADDDPSPAVTPKNIDGKRGEKEKENLPYVPSTQSTVSIKVYGPSSASSTLKETGSSNIKEGGNEAHENELPVSKLHNSLATNSLNIPSTNFHGNVGMRVISGNREMTVAELIRLISLSFSVDQDEVSAYHLVTIDANDQVMSEDIQKLQTLGKIHRFLEAHDNVSLHFLRKDLKQGEIRRKRSNSVS